MGLGRAKTVSGEANGASAIGHELDTTASLSTAGAKILSVKNQGVEKFAVDKDGTVTTSGSLPAGTELSSTTSLNAYIDNDNNSTTETFDIYKDVTVPTVVSLLMRIAESGQHSFGTDLPFQNVATAAMDLSSGSYQGLHIKSSVGATLILEGAANAVANVVFARTNASGPVIRQWWDNSNDSMFFTKMSLSNFDTIISYMLQMTPSGTNGGGVGVGMPIGANVGGLYIAGNNAVSESVIELNMNPAGTVRRAGRIAITNGNSVTPSARQMFIEAEYNAGFFALPAITFKGNTGNTLPPYVGFGTYTPDYFVEVDRLEEGTNMVQMAGLASANGSGNTLKAYRNLTATSTDAPVAFVHQDHASDDQDALQINQDGSGNIIKSLNGATEEFTVTNAGAIKVQGVQVVTTQQAAVTAPTGGAIIDSEARTAINDLIARLQAHGLIA